MEIEQKYLVINIPDNIDECESVIIEQGYLSTDPVVRIRQYQMKNKFQDNDYFLTYKSRKGITQEQGIIANQEVELPLTKESYEHLRTKIDGRLIKKTRYLIPLEDKLKVELDVFHGDYEGMILAEVEFPSISLAKEFKKPTWLGENVSDDKKYTNSFLSLQ